MRDGQHLIQLVADEDDAAPGLGEPAEQEEDLLRLLWGQHRRRFVEDQDPCVPVEGLQDLDTLLLADRQAADLRVGVDVESEPGREVADPARRLPAIQEQGVRHRLVAQDDVLGHGQHRHEHEVLMDHADAVVDGVARSTHGHRLSVQQDLALVGTGEAVEDVHEGGLAGAVLAQERMDLAGAHVQVDVVVRDDARISLGDAAHLESRHDHRSVGHVVHLNTTGSGIDERGDPPLACRPASVNGSAGALLQRAAVVRAGRWTVLRPAMAASSVAWISGVMRLALSWKAETPMPSLAAM